MSKRYVIMVEFEVESDGAIHAEEALRDYLSVGEPVVSYVIGEAALVR